MSFIVIIPARYASTRLPAKPLRDIAGLSMIQRVWQQARMSHAERVVIATDDNRIEQAVEAFGAEVCMTRADHVSGTDRLQEVAQLLRLDQDQLVINVQGDEPLIPPGVINQVADNLAQSLEAGVATLCEPIQFLEDFLNPNVVKVVRDKQDMASYFSRAAVPWPRDHFLHGQSSMPDTAPRRHIGIYAYRVAQLNSLVTWQVAPSEHSESLEQLRFLWNDVGIHVADALEPVPAGIDTEADLMAVIEKIKLTNINGL
jgi:3-deoxy-manno-octulosonate cytidylyltransferase (CMP-KDO synthetase)